MNFGQPDYYRKAAEQACRLYSLENSVTISLLQLSENATFLLAGAQDNVPWKVMRVARTGYRALEEIQAELQWIEHLSHQDKVKISPAVKNVRGSFLTIVETDGRTYACILFEYLQGVHPDPADPLRETETLEDFFQIGQIAASLHADTAAWTESRRLARPHWDYSHMVGEQGLFGNWRQCRELDPADRRLLERACARIRERLSLCGRDHENYGLIHSDLRAANLLKKEGRIQVIDFDDCGFGWHMYDLAASISFVEDHPKAGQWAEAWLRGYETVRPLKKDDIKELPTFIMARRIQLLAWLTSHRDSDPAESLYPGFARKTAQLAEKYIERAGRQL